MRRALYKQTIKPFQSNPTEPIKTQTRLPLTIALGLALTEELPTRLGTLVERPPLLVATAVIVTARPSLASELLEEIDPGLPVFPLVHQLCASRPGKRGRRSGRPLELPVGGVQVVKVAPTPLPGEASDTSRD